MPTPRDIRRYPPEFLHIVKSIARTGEPVVLGPQERKTLTRLRLMFNAWRILLRENDELITNLLTMKEIETLASLEVAMEVFDKNTARLIWRVSSLSQIMQYLPAEDGAGTQAPPGFEPPHDPINFHKDYTEDAVNRYLKGDFDKDKKDE